MASFAARRSPRAAWSVEESARFAALKEFALLRLLSTDRKAFATAGTSSRPLLLPIAVATAQQVNRCWWGDCGAQQAGCCSSAGVCRAKR